jgi:arylsulfatase A-like enzyme
LTPRLSKFPRQPGALDSLEQVRRVFDGYDTGVRYADNHFGRILQCLENLAVLDETAVIVSADHGESQGEFNIWGDHQTADHSTCRVPLVVRWPGCFEGGSVDGELHYQVDWAATLIEGAGGTVPPNWDGRSFWHSRKGGKPAGRPFLVMSQGAHICQRGIRFDADGAPYLCLWTLNPGYKMIEPVMLFDLSSDPHEQHDLSNDRPDLVDRALGHLATWHQAMIRTADTPVDPLMTALGEGPLHARGKLHHYAERLRATGRANQVQALLARQQGVELSL